MDKKTEEGLQTLAKCSEVAKRAANLIEDNLPDYFEDFSDREDYRIRAAMYLEDYNKVHPLRLDDMIEGDGPSLIHDVTGILRNWNPTTKTMEDTYWSPRYSA